MDHLKTLFVKYMNKGCTTAEIKLLLQTFAEVKNEAELKEAIALELQKEYEEEEEEDRLNSKMLRIYQQLKPGLGLAVESEAVIRPIRNYFKYGIAAAVLLVLSTVTYLYISQNKTKEHLTVQRQAEAINPGGNKAVLTLADGSEISLTDAGNGELAKQAGITITKAADGQLVYELAGGLAGQNEMAYNTISTPAGGQYQINLPDGSRVWLNAESSLRYPTVFNATERKVELKGEAYFEIAKNEAKPFFVSTNGAGKAQEVKVLGTHFNINSYVNEEATKTTLLEGSVKVTSGMLTKTLRPGQQSVLASNLQVFDVDAISAVDWKDGNFNFNDESIYSIMRKLARWYNIEVVYQGNVTNVDFGAEISRDKKLAEVLKVLERAGGINFKIEGRRVTVMQ
jgi:transmembrane sensor